MMIHFPWHSVMFGETHPEAYLVHEMFLKHLKKSLEHSWKLWTFFGCFFFGKPELPGIEM